MFKETTIELKNIQHIKHLKCNFKLANNIYCIVGKNGSGKTTLIKAIKNITSTDTFKTTSSNRIFDEHSEINYSFDNKEYKFVYNNKLQTLDTKDAIDISIQKNIQVELPLPFGDRFNKKFEKSDDEIRISNIDGDYIIPEEVINLYKNIYNSNKFNDLKLTKGKKGYYFLSSSRDRYIREDHFSSGEFFILSIYKLLQRKKLIVIDEIDISLDSHAQVNLITELRKYCKKYKSTIIFTSHSLAMMKKLETKELLYLENENGDCKLECKSYNYIKSVLFQITGYDKYIIVEDKCSQLFIKYLLQDQVISSEYLIFYAGGCKEVKDLFKRNKNEQFFTDDPNNVLQVLDGDQQDNNNQNQYIKFLPFQDIEQELCRLYSTNNESEFFTSTQINAEDDPKSLFKKVLAKYQNNQIIFDFIIKNNKTNVDTFKDVLLKFLNQ
jgi:ABC-type multidrug transport system ATPase subunit